MINKRSLIYLSVFLFFFHSAFAIVFIFLPVYFQNIGLTVSEIGQLMALVTFTGLLSQNFWGYISDKYKTMKRILVLCLLGMAITGVILFQLGSLMWLMIITSLFFAFMIPVVALGESFTYKTTNMMGISFGSLLIWGSFGFSITSLVGGQILSVIGIEQLLYPVMITTIIAFFLSLKLTDVPTNKTTVNFGELVGLLKNRHFILFLLVMIFLTVSHRMNDVFFGLYIIELGGNEAKIGWGWFIALMSEVVIFATSTLWFKRFHELTFMFIGGLLYTVRWFLFALADNTVVVIILQAAHGISYAVFYICAFHFVSKLVPKHLEATGHLIFLSLFFGLSGMIGSLVGGQVIEQFNGSVLYFVMGVIAMVGSFGILGYKYYFLKNIKNP